MRGVMCMLDEKAIEMIERLLSEGKDVMIQKRKMGIIILSSKVKTEYTIE
jgi:hypothetical protein